MKDIYWKDIKALVPKAWVKNISETELMIETTWGAELRLVGLDKPQRMEGVAWDGGTVDEIASAKKGLFDANIRPAIADRRGGVDLIGVPDFSGPAQDEYRTFCEMGQSGEHREWADFAWGSEGILPAEEIESMRGSMDPRLFKQETTGAFIVASGLAFPDFDAKVHATSEHAKRVTQYDPALPICWSLDFNVNPLCSGVIQHVKGEVRVIDEIELPDTVTPMAVTAFLDRAKIRGWNLDNLTIYGDASGNARHTTADQPGMTDWILVRNGLKDVPHRMKVPSRNPALADTRNAVNAKIRSADGSVALYVNPNCRRLIADLRSSLWPTPDDWHEQHCLAWLRYFVSWEYPVRSTRVVAPTPSAVL